MQGFNFFKTKNFVGRGLSIEPERLRLATTILKEDKIHIVSLEEVPLSSPEITDVSQALPFFKIPPHSKIAINLWDESLKIKKVKIPKMPKKDIAEALRYQLIEDSENTNSPLEIRYTPFHKPNVHTDSLEFMVYGISKEFIAERKKWYQDLGLNVVVAEPPAVSLAAWEVALNPDSPKIRGIFLLQNKRIEFIGLQENHLLYWKYFKPDASLSLEAALSELSIQFQQAIDDFLLYYQFHRMDEAVFAGDWDIPTRNILETSLGIPCKRMGENNFSRLCFSEEAQKEKISSFAVTLGLSIYPEGEL